MLRQEISMSTEKGGSPQTKGGETSPSPLPERAFIDNPWTNELKACRYFTNTDAPVIAVIRGETGFHPIYTDASADELNAVENVSPAQREAMLHGSMFGFDTPGATVETQERLLATGKPRRQE